MPCRHKFHRFLNLDLIDFEPTTLIVGTFNPEWPATNTAQWFYGRTTNNNFWDVLPRLYGEPTLINGLPPDWKSFCSRWSIAITDLISSIEDADENNQYDVELLGGYSDKAIASSFNQHTFVDLLSILRDNPTIRNVYLTRGTGTFWNKRWRTVVRFCNENAKRAKTLLTPSGYAYYQQGRYNNLHPDAHLNLQDFILMRWRSEWHQI